MQQFKLKEKGAKEITKQSIMRVIPMMFIVVAGIVIFTIYNTDDTAGTSLIPLIAPIPIIAIVLFFGFRRGYKRQCRIFESYMLTITEEGVRREQGDTPVISLLFSEITKLTKNKKGWLTLKANNSSEIIFIPPQLNEYDLAVKTITEKCSVAIEDAGLKQAMYLSILYGAGGFALFMGLYFSKNIVVEVISGVLLSAFLTWAFFKNLQNKNVDRKTRQGSYILIGVILCVIGLVISKLYGISMMQLFE